ncbi:MAG: hypothetical protein H6659_17180 [Ardenticatenaceae bacterium]|nr:hypothetical protein [Ardenticatenaceae bacterium]MCB8987303.1 hypothetical protein [Ardenticatenaceae bacterium]
MTTGKTNRAFNLVFILQLRQEQDVQSGTLDPLRIILQNPQTGDQYSFPSLDQLTRFLVQKLEDR